MQITRATDYAVRLMVYLASLPEGTRVPVSGLARATQAPETFVSKILQQLVRVGMVQSVRGMGGGFQLAGRPEEVTLLEVVEAVEGPLQINLCLPGAETCGRMNWCTAHPIWNEAQAALKRVLAGASIGDLAREAKNHAIPDPPFNHALLRPFNPSDPSAAIAADDGLEPHP